MHSCQAYLGQPLRFRSDARDFKPYPLPLGLKPLLSQSTDLEWVTKLSFPLYDILKKKTHWCTCVYLLYFVSHNVSKRIRHVVDFQCPCVAWKAVNMTLFRTASLSLTYRHASRTDVHIILHIVQSYYFQVPQNADTVELTQFGGGSAH